MGKRRCRFRFRLDLGRGGFSLSSGFEKEEGNKKGNSTHNAKRLSPRRGNRWRKRNGMAKKKKNSPPTSNIHSGISVASSLIFSLILSLRRLSTALWLSLRRRRFSFASKACLSPTGCCPCCWGACCPPCPPACPCAAEGGETWDGGGNCTC